MSILHKFLNTPPDFPNGFGTHDAILDVTPYDPEVIFIGTFNPQVAWNIADFYYGRDMYMWTILGNLFLNGSNQWKKRRSTLPLTPSFNQVFEICTKGKIVFADIIKGISPGITTVINQTEKTVLVSNEYTWASYKDSELMYMAEREWLDDNVDAIANFINHTHSIKHVYFTFKTGAWFVQKQNQINAQLRDGVTTGSIFTPSGNGFGKLLPAPFDNRAASIAHCWVWNNLAHRVPINREGYTNLDHGWLTRSGVNVTLF